MRTCIYNKNGESKIVETLEERDQAYTSGNWFDSPTTAQDAAKSDMEETQRKIKQNEEKQRKLAEKAEADRIAAEQAEADRVAANKKTQTKVGE